MLVAPTLEHTALPPPMRLAPRRACPNLAHARSFARLPFSAPLPLALDVNQLQNSLFFVLLFAAA